jgi:hypothetical protein
VEEPDLLIYKPDFSEVRFTEVKRRDTHDKLREKQIVGLALLSLLFGCPVEVFEVFEKGKERTVQLLYWSCSSAFFHLHCSSIRIVTHSEKYI